MHSEVSSVLVRFNQAAEELRHASGEKLRIEALLESMRVSLEARGEDEGELLLVTLDRIILGALASRNGTRNLLQRFNHSASRLLPESSGALQFEEIFEPLRFLLNELTDAEGERFLGMLCRIIIRTLKE